MLPFWTSFLIRVYAWIALLKPSGLVNQLLIAVGLIETPLPLLYNAFSVQLGLVYSYLPFMILPLYGSLARLDESLLEAAADLGARPLRAFLGVTLPLTLPGIAAGSLLVFIPAVGEFVIPDLLGGADTLMIGKVLWQEFFNNVDWPAASAVAVALVAVLSAAAPRGAAILGRERRCGRRRAALRVGALALGLGFLYAADRGAGRLFVQRLAAGHDLGRVFDPLVRRTAGNERFRAAALTSLEMAVMAASLALVLGTLRRARR